MPTNQFFEFLRYCLSDDMPIPESVKTMDWEALFDFASKQTLVGVYFYGIKRLPKECAPSGATLIKWFATAERIKKANIRVTKVADKVTKLFAENGFRTFVLKGQGNALMYPDPWVRTPGDIDLFVGGGDEKVLAFCRKKMNAGHFCYHHVEVDSVDGVSLEVHYRATFLQHPLHNRRLQIWLDQNYEKQFDNVVTTDIAGQNFLFSMPKAEFNLIYQLVHMATHFLNEGFGLRQLVDYYMLLITTEISLLRSAELLQKLADFGLANFAGGVMWVLQHCLKLPAERCIAPADERFGRVLLNEIIIGGNFGQHDERVSEWRRTTFLGANIQRLLRDIRLFRYYPSEALAEPMFRVWHLLWRVWHRK